jgi:hypothetical protein
VVVGGGDRRVEASIGTQQSSLTNNRGDARMGVLAVATAAVGAVARRHNDEGAKEARQGGSTTAAATTSASRSRRRRTTVV